MAGLIELVDLKGHWNLRLVHVHIPMCTYIEAMLITPNPKTTLKSRYARDMSDHDHKIQTRSSMNRSSRARHTDHLKVHKIYSQWET